MTATDRVHVVIVNYRTPDMVVACLDSLARERVEVGGLTVTVVDNASGDDSAGILQEAVAERGHGDWVEIHPHDRNDGFGAGNNIALQAALQQDPPPDLFLILNPDTEVLPGAIGRMMAFLETHPEVGILGPRTESTPGTADCTAFRFPGFLNSISDGLRLGLIDRLLAASITAPTPRQEAHPTDWVSGGCMLVRRELLENCGLFDERFFLYFEEIDLCHRALKEGFATWYLPDAGVMHWAGASTGIASSGREPKRMPPWWFASRRHYLGKFHGAAYVLACDLAFLGARSLWTLRYWITRRSSEDPPHFLWDFFRYNLLGRRW